MVGTCGVAETEDEIRDDPGRKKKQSAGKIS